MAEILVSALLSFISLRVLILSPGFYDYSDVHWGIIATPHLLGTFSPFHTAAGFVLYGFMRDIVSWPYYIMYQLGIPMDAIERILLMYSFTLYFVIAFRLSDYIITSLEDRSNFRIGAWERFGLSFIVSIFAFANLAAMNYNVDGGTFTDGLILLFMSCAIAVLLFQTNRNRKIALLSFFIIISTLLDPDYFIYFLILIVFGLVASGLMENNIRKNMLVGVIVTVFSLLPIALIFIVGVYTTPASQAISVLGVYRHLPTSVSPFSIQSPYFLYYLMLFGHGWSTMAYGPITLLEYYGHILDAPGMLSPTQILIPPGPVTALWFACLVAIFITAFLSISFKITRKFAITASLIAVFILFLSQYNYISPLLYIFDKIASIPFIGSPFATTFGRPAHALMVISATYIVMIAIFLFNVNVYRHEPAKFKSLARSKKSRVRIRMNSLLKVHISSRTRENISRAVIGIVIFVIIFSGWQAFNGDFYPSRAFPPDSGGNQIPEMAPFQPYEVPQSAMNVLNFLKMEETSPVQVLQIVAPYLSNQTFLGFEGNINPHPRLDGNSLVGNYVNELISQNLTTDIAPLLRANSIGYVVVEFYKITPSFVHNEFGFSNFGIVLNELRNTPGLTAILSYPNITLYRVNEVNNLFYSPQINLYMPNSGNLSPAMYESFSLLGFNVSGTYESGYGINFSMNEPEKGLQSNISLFTPSYLFQIMNTSSVHNGKNLTSTTGLPFSHTMSLNSGELSLAGASGFAYLYLMGEGTINGLSYNTKGVWEEISVPYKNKIILNGSFNISFIVTSRNNPLNWYVKNSVVYNVGAARGYELKTGNKIISGGITTVFGTNLFYGAIGNDYTVSAPFAKYVELYYYLIIVILMYLGTIALGYNFVCIIRKYEKKLREKFIFLYRNK